MTINLNYWEEKNRLFTKTVNWHITSKCNYECKFCSVHKFDCEIKDLSQASNILAKIQKNDSSDIKIGCLNLTGGEPTLHPLFYDILRTIHENGIPTWVSTNGSTLNRENIKIISQYAEGVTISVDSISDTKEKSLGRGFGNHISNVLKISDMIHETGIKLGINTIVTKSNYDENLRPLIHRINPHIWNILQRLPVPYQNNDFIDEMANDPMFDEFIWKHSHVRLRDGIKPSFQKKEDVLKSYLILSSEGVIKNWNETSRFKIVG